MNYDDYFVAPETVKLMMQRKMLNQLEYNFHIEMADLEDDEAPLDFETFLNRTIKDMELFDNYEGAAIVRDIKQAHGWK